MALLNVQYLRLQIWKRCEVATWFVDVVASDFGVVHHVIWKRKRQSVTDLHYFRFVGNLEKEKLQELIQEHLEMTSHKFKIF